MARRDMKATTPPLRGTPPEEGNFATTQRRRNPSELRSRWTSSVRCCLQIRNHLTDESQVWLEILG